MAELSSAEVPPVGADDHVRGSGPEAILYMDLACPQCAAAWPAIRALELTVCVRHFPVASKRPRALALHAAVEAAAAQREDAFWEMWDAIYAGHGHLDDPHLWERARLLGLDLTRFDADRRSAEVANRIRAVFEGGIRAGVSATPTAFAAGRRIAGELPGALAAITAR
jgi:protein-disulfide isomerase